MASISTILKQKIAQLEKLEDDLQRLRSDFNTKAGGGVGSEEVEVVEEWAKVKHLRERLFLLDQSIDIDEDSLKNALKYNIPEDTQERLRESVKRDIKRADAILKASARTINAASKTFSRMLVELKNAPWRGNKLPLLTITEAEDTALPVSKQATQSEEPDKPIPKTQLPPVEKPIKKIIPKPPPAPPAEQARSHNQIAKEVEVSIEKFNRKIPAIQKDVLAGIEEELRDLDLDGGKIKATVKNLALISRIKNKLIKLIVTDEYKEEVKAFAESFNKVTELQNAYWKQLESTFKPKALLREIRNISISDTVNKLMGSGINANLVDPVSDILRTNITAGGSYRALTDQLRQSLTDTNTPGLLSKYAKTTTTDALNTYSAQYAQIVSSDLGFEWYKYSNTDIVTTRPFCDAMTDRPFFHVSEIPQLLRAEGLTYVNKKGQRISVPIYQRTGLPHGMKDGTDASNFLINRGGWNCGHQCRPISEGLVPQTDKDRVFASPGYLRWKSS